MGAFGDKFRKAREKKELSLDDVSNVTKISSRMLQAIEQERFDQLPGGVFNKGFIRAYAKHLGLNDEEAVTDYLACLRQAQIDAHEVWQPEPPAPPRPAIADKPRGAAPTRPDLKKPEAKKPELNRPVLNKPPAKPHPSAAVEELPELQLPRAEDIRPRRREFGESSAPQIPWRIVALTAVVIVLGIILWTRRSHGTNTAAASTTPAKTMQPASAPVPTNPPTAAIAKPTNSQPQRTAALAPTHPATTASTPPLAVRTGTPDAGTDNNASHQSENAKNQSDATENVPGSVAENVTQSITRNDKNDVTVRTFPRSNPVPPDKSAVNLTLTIRATETSWISVTADGQPVAHETLIAPAHTSVRASREIVARIGNAAGVTFLWNGQEIPADGAEAEVKTFVFDSAGMRVIPTTPPATH